MKVINIVRYQMTKEDYAFIKPQLKAKKIRLRQLGEKVGLSKQYICEILNGKKYINYDLLKVLQDNGIIVPFSNYYQEEER